MRWNIYAVKPDGPWKRWFAWYPIELGAFGDRVWLEWVERKTVYTGMPSFPKYYRYRHVETV